MPASVRSKGAWASGATSFTAAVPTGGGAPQAGDALYIIMESADSSTASGTPSTPSGWDLLFHDVTREGLTGASALTVFGKIAGASESDVSVSGVGDHCDGSMLVVQGHGLAAITDTQVGAAGSSTGNTAITIPGITTADADTLVILVVSTSRDFATTANFSGWTNANLSSITEREDEATGTGQGGGIGYADGLKASAGATGSSTVTQAAASGWVSVHLGIPPVGLTTVTIDTPGALTLAGRAVVLNTQVGVVSPGAVALTGGPILLTMMVVATPGELALAGATDITAQVVTIVPIDTPGGLTLGGGTIALTTQVVATPGALTLAGGTVVLTTTIVDSPGAMALAGQEVDLATQALVMTPGALTLAGGTITLTATIVPTPGALQLAGQAAALQLLEVLAAGAITFAGQTIALVEAGESGPADLSAQASGPDQRPQLATPDLAMAGTAGDCRGQLATADLAAEASGPS